MNKNIKIVIGMVLGIVLAGALSVMAVERFSETVIFGKAPNGAPVALAVTDGGFLQTISTISTPDGGLPVTDTVLQGKVDVLNGTILTTGDTAHADMLSLESKVDYIASSALTTGATAHADMLSLESKVDYIASSALTTGATAHSDALNIRGDLYSTVLALSNIQSAVSDVYLHDYSSNTPGADIRLIGKVIPARPTSSSTFGVEHLATTAGSTYTLPTGAYQCDIQNRGPNYVRFVVGGSPSTSVGWQLAAYGGAATDPLDSATVAIPLTVTTIGFLTVNANQLTTAATNISCMVR